MGASVSRGLRRHEGHAKGDAQDPFVLLARRSQ
jgi:hypothetical protein